jgi:hypoxanthine phosphoribosyltransferase
MKKLTLKQITEKIKEINFPKFDLIIAIGRDGIMPASLLKHFLKTEVKTIFINYRDENNKPIKKEPILTKPIKEEIKNKNLLIVDTISKTGKTLKKAKEILKENNIKTFVINGKADYSLFNFKECIEWPW